MNLQPIGCGRGRFDPQQGWSAREPPLESGKDPLDDGQGGEEGGGLQLNTDTTLYLADIPLHIEASHQGCA